MGAGLAAQRGWPQGQEQDPTSPHSTNATTSESEEQYEDSAGRHHQEQDGIGEVGNDLLLYEEVAQTEVQPLEDVEYARTYGSVASLTSLVPLDRKRQSSVGENSENGEGALPRFAGSNVEPEWGSVPGESKPLGAGGHRTGREQSVAYDLGAVLSTEEEVRVCALSQSVHISQR